MSVPKALFFLPDFGGGGAQRTLINLAAAMPPDLLDLQLAVGDARGPARAWLNPGQDYIDLQSRRMRSSFFALTRLIRQMRPDAVLTTMIHGNITAWLATRLGCKDSAIILRETNSHRARPELSPVHRGLARLVYPKADLLISLSEGVRQELITDMVLREEQIITIPNPVAVKTIREQVQEAGRKPAPWAGQLQGPRILAVGRMVQQKAYDVLLNAVAGLNENTHLVILGEGPDRAALSAQAARLGIAERVAMPGFVEDTAPYYAHADVFALSSRWEGFGHVIVEAMAAGLPVVSTDCPYGPADIIIPGETGLLVPPENPRELGNVLGEVLADPVLSRRLVRAGSERAELFEIGVVARRYGEAVRAVIAVRQS